ncbi:MAG TPA: hypothetical protein VG944_04480 [Fimbriimonas sp.]|nr:hypothetical protein [Fimbriimonas sp.]
MRNDNYPSSSQIVRNLSDITSKFEVIYAEGKFRILKFAPPYFGGYEYWVVNEKGFMWEPALSPEDGLSYLESDEAKEYNSTA